MGFGMPGGHPLAQGIYGPGSMGAPSASPHQQQQYGGGAMKGRVRGGGGMAGGAVDPLDPGAAGYTERFGAQKRKKPSPAAESEGVDIAHVEVAEQSDLVGPPQPQVEQPQREEMFVPVPLPAPAPAPLPPQVPLPPTARVGEACTEQRPAALAGLADYGDDSDDDNNQDTAIVPPPAVAKTEVKIDVEALMKRRRLLPPASSSPGHDCVGPSAGPSCDYGPSVGPDMGPACGPELPPAYPADIGPTHVPCAPFSHARDIEPSAAVSQGMETGPDGSPGAPCTVPMPRAVPAAAKVQVPKLVKVDAGLVSFVPAALRVKRQHQVKPDDTAVVLEKFRRAGGNHSGEARVETNSGEISVPESEKPIVGAAKAQSSVDDVYASFMSEINELGGF